MPASMTALMYAFSKTRCRKHQNPDTLLEP
jgi:hypothetical protein